MTISDLTSIRSLVKILGRYLRARDRVRNKVLASVVCLPSLVFVSCSTNRVGGSGPHECVEAPLNASPTEASSGDQPGMAVALRRFREAEDSAISVILQLAESVEHEKRLRVCDLSEAEWIAQAGVHWESQRTELAGLLQDLRFLSNELVSRAAYANGAGDVRLARKYLNAAKRLGAANRGPGVPLVCDIVGKAIEELADKNLATMSE